MIKKHTSITCLMQRAVVAFPCPAYWLTVAEATLDTTLPRSPRTLNRPFPFPPALALAPALATAPPPVAVAVAEAVAVTTVGISSSSSSPGVKSMRLRRLPRRPLRSVLPPLSRRFRFPKLAKYVVRKSPSKTAKNKHNVRDYVIASVKFAYML